MVHVVRSGETLYTIGRRHNVSFWRMLQANPQLRNPNRIYPGEIIIVPRW